MSNTIEITQERYDALLQEHFEHNLLINTIFNNVNSRAWDDDLRINDDTPILELLNGMYPTRYADVKKFCMEEKAKKEAAKKEAAESEDKPCSED